MKVKKYVSLYENNEEMKIYKTDGGMFGFKDKEGKYHYYPSEEHAKNALNIHSQPQEEYLDWSKVQDEHIKHKKPLQNQDSIKNKVINADGEEATSYDLSGGRRGEPYYFYDDQGEKYENEDYDSIKDKMEELKPGSSKKQDLTNPDVDDDGWNSRYHDFDDFPRRGRRG